MRRADRKRPPASERGYDATWRRVRAEVLRAAGIPESEWPKSGVGHRPRYNPALEPDHREYELVPMLRGSHSSKTATQDGAFGRGPAAQSSKAGGAVSGGSLCAAQETAVKRLGTAMIHIGFGGAEPM